VTLDGHLPDWSDPATPAEAYQRLTHTAAAFAATDDTDRRIAVHAYADAYCLPAFRLAKASGLYLFLRVLFDLPADAARDDVRVFGGWLHPSIGGPGDRFDLSWPVRVDTTGALHVAPFPGYFGKGYDAAGEYDWFAATFPLRTQPAHAVVPPGAPT
jgi:hypothetical protein